MIPKYLAIILGIILLAATNLGGSVNASEALQIDFVVSEPCSLTTFVDAISDRPHTTTWLKKWYLQKRRSSASPELRAKDRELCQLYRALMDSDENACEFKDPTGRPLNLDQEIISLAAKSSSLPELLNKMKAVMKDADFQTLKSVYEYFEPVYRQLIWEPRLACLKQQLAEFQQETLKSHLTESLCRVQKFMNATWVPGLPFTVVLVPLPQGGRSTHGESLGAIQIVELLPKSKFSTQIDVVFHEDCHALWNSKKNSAEVQRLFQSSGVDKPAYSEFDEGMATALGQGWFMKEAFAKTQKLWYTDRIIDTYAHALLPLFTDYLKNNKSFDAEFAKQACSIFNKHFPDLEKSVVFTSSYQIMADSIADMSELKSALSKYLPRLHSLSISTPIAAAESIRSFKEDRSEMRAVLLSSEKLEQISELGFSKAQIDFLKTVAGKPVTLMLGTKKILFCIAGSPEKQQEILLSVLSKEKWTAITTQDIH